MNMIKLLGSLFCIFPCWYLSAWEPTDSVLFEKLLNDTGAEVRSIQSEFSGKRMQIIADLLQAEQSLGDDALNEQQYRNAVKRCFELERALRVNEQLTDLQLLKTRYKKGIDIIKILYEKVLGLDHHYTGLQTFQNVLMLSNPNTYPDFQKAKATMQQKLKNKFAIRMPGILESNPFLTAAFSMVAAMLGDGETKEKEADFEKISCILDFTVRMNADLSVIYHETEYLKEYNKTLKLGCEKLFDDYVKVIGYASPIDKCRKGDDWETVYEQLNQYVDKINTQLTAGSFTAGDRSIINLAFATNRVADFIGRYNDYITQGTQYYQKFDNIISGYENQDVCEQRLPRQLSALQFDIKSTIDKFTNTYNIPEIEGSKLKDLLYGAIDK